VVVSNKPYSENKKNNKTIRVFNESVNSDELVWHRDKKDRLVEVIESKGWMFQLDDEYPVELKCGDTFFIPMNIYHRVIKGKGNLIISFTES